MVQCGPHLYSDPGKVQRPGASRGGRQVPKPPKKATKTWLIAGRKLPQCVGPFFSMIITLSEFNIAMETHLFFTG